MIKQGNRRNVRKIHATGEFIEGNFFQITKKHVFRYSLGEYWYQISGLCRFSFGQEVRHRWKDRLKERHTCILVEIRKHTPPS